VARNPRSCGVAEGPRGGFRLTELCSTALRGTSPQNIVPRFAPGQKNASSRGMFSTTTRLDRSIHASMLMSESISSRLPTSSGVR
jgi:hypothetical protein